MYRVKLPKSFLAVNLSETHTFHKKEEQETEDVQGLALGGEENSGLDSVSKGNEENKND